MTTTTKQKRAPGAGRPSRYGEAMIGLPSRVPGSVKAKLIARFGSVQAAVDALVIRPMIKKEQGAMEFTAESPGDPAVGIEPERATISFSSLVPGNLEGIDRVRLILNAAFKEIFDNVDAYITDR